MYVFLLACVQVATVAVCTPEGEFTSPEPDRMELDSNRSLRVSVEARCVTADAVLVEWSRSDGSADGQVSLTCEAAAPGAVRCSGEVDASELGSCSGVATWSILRLIELRGLDTAAESDAVLDEVGVPFALGER